MPRWSGACHTPSRRTGCQTRRSRRLERAVDEAEQYIYEKLSGYGLSSVTYQTSPGDGNALSGPEGRNVVGQITGTTKPNEIDVVGAHLDDMNDATWPNGMAPGADDNASGGSAVLYVARAFAGHTFARTIASLFDAEENAAVGHRGGRHRRLGLLAAQCKAAGQNIVATINLDALGVELPKSARTIIECHTRKGNADPSGGDAAIVDDVVGTASPPTRSPASPRRRSPTPVEQQELSDWTDNGSLWRWGGYGGVEGYRGSGLQRKRR